MSFILTLLCAVRALVEWPMRLLWSPTRRILWPSLSALHWAAYDGADASKLVRLVKRSPSALEGRDRDGRTPLFYAANDHVRSPLFF